MLNNIIHVCVLFLWFTILLQCRSHSLSYKEKEHLYKPQKRLLVHRILASINDVWHPTTQQWVYHTGHTAYLYKAASVHSTIGCGIYHYHTLINIHCWNYLYMYIGLFGFNSHLVQSQLKINVMPIIAYTRLHPLVEKSYCRPVVVTQIRADLRCQQSRAMAKSCHP